MKLKLLFLVVLTALLFSANAYGQDLSIAGPKKPRITEDYKPRTLQEIAAQGALANAGKKNGTEVLTGDLMPSRVRVTYHSARRPLSRPGRDLIFHWAQQYAGDPQHYTLPYQTELLFREDGRNHWLVVNKNLNTRFRQEIKHGTAIDLNLIRLGGFKSKGKWVWVLLVESIAQPKPTQ